MSRTGPPDIPQMGNSTGNTSSGTISRESNPSSGGSINRGRGRGRGAFSTAGARSRNSEGPTASPQDAPEGPNSAITISNSSISASEQQRGITQTDRGAHGTGRGKGRVRGGGWGRNRNNITEEPSHTVNAGATKNAQQARPTHFLALPLHNHSTLREKVAEFQASLFESPSVNGDQGSTAAVDASKPRSGGMSDSKAAIPNTTTPSSHQKGKGRARKPVVTSPTVAGLDTSIVIDPRRMHMTLGVMALSTEKSDDLAPEETGETSKTVEANPSLASTSAPSIPSVDAAQPIAGPSEETFSSPPDVSNIHSTSPPPTTEPKTVSSALSLLASLKPRISEILNGSKGVLVPLEELDVLKTSRMPASVKANTELTLDDDSRVGAGVLFIGPRNEAYTQENEDREERTKLMEVCVLVDSAFRKAGYITDRRPLKLHCTILNASHHKPPKRLPFCYSDILRSPAISLISSTPSSSSIPLVPADISNQGTVSINPPLETVDSEYLDVKSNEEQDFPITNLVSSDPALPFTSTNTPSPPPHPNPNTTKEVFEGEDKQPTRIRPQPLQVPPPLLTNLGAYRVHEIQLWEMGSHGPNNEYVNCGGIVLE
ncbi:hypothetical protein JR316_0006617 [Psilocybe cubensis]|uniref:Uncharacterized protein n=2 Tax=Psilocybe cubensis TaxID=181762 RepID=A0ACB8GYH0_PSICU|nr:hypothetical protein JR316_0006617 [Psilocybe cubensis]KAH9480020.1 hypothetical protein JR316_0006617 [Psilocybe cubensis]